MTISVAGKSVFQNITAYHHNYDGADGYIVAQGGQSTFVIQDEAARFGVYLLGIDPDSEVGQKLIQTVTAELTITDE